MEDKYTEILRVMMRPEQKERIKAEAEKEGVTMSDIVRRALKVYYEKENKNGS